MEILFTPPALTAVTLLLAKSSPNDKDKMVSLVCVFLIKKSVIK